MGKKSRKRAGTFRVLKKAKKKGRNIYDFCESYCEGGGKEKGGGEGGGSFSFFHGYSTHTKSGEEKGLWRNDCCLTE